MESKILKSSLILVCSLFRSYLPKDLMLVETLLSYLRTMWTEFVLLKKFRPGLGLLLLITVVEFH